MDEPWEEPFPPPRACSGLGDNLGLAPVEDLARGTEDKLGLEANQVPVAGEQDLVVEEPWEEPFRPPRTCSGLGDDLGLAPVEDFARGTEDNLGSKLIRFRLQENGIS